MSNKNKEIATELIRLQSTFNDRVSPNWEKAKYNWRAAIIAEVGELIESTDYKWWKKTEVDLDNIKVEAIDVLHFFISDFVAQLGRDKVISCFVENQNKPRLDYGILYYTDLFLTHYLMREYEEATSYLFDMLYTLGFTSFDFIFKAYLTKNVLNLVRQDRGYKDGSYIKIWNDEEDNVIVYQLADMLYGLDTPVEIMFDTLYKNTIEYYDTKVAQ